MIVLHDAFGPLLHLDRRDVAGLSWLKVRAQVWRNGIRRRRKYGVPRGEPFTEQEGAIIEALLELERNTDRLLCLVDNPLQPKKERNTNMDEKTKIEELEAQLAERTKELTALRVSVEFRRLAKEHGVPDAALEDVELRGAQAFTLKDGQLVDEATYRTPGEWFRSLKVTAPHLFEAKAEGSGVNVTTGKKRSEMNAAERARFIGEHGGEAYLKLPE